MKEDWWKYALIALAAISWWFVKVELEDFRAQNKAQWQESARTKECIFNMIHDHSKEINFLKGLQEAENRRKK